MNNKENNNQVTGKIERGISKRKMVNTISKNINLLDFLYRLLNGNYKDRKRQIVHQI